MNERIKLLAEQAGLKYYNWINNVSNINDGDFTYPRLEDYEKFAELIVRECVDIASKYDEPKMSGPGLMIGHMIEQHFGVEE